MKKFDKSDLLDIIQDLKDDISTETFIYHGFHTYCLDSIINGEHNWTEIQPYLEQINSRLEEIGLSLKTCSIYFTPVLSIVKYDIPDANLYRTNKIESIRLFYTTKTEASSPKKPGLIKKFKDLFD